MTADEFLTTATAVLDPSPRPAVVGVPEIFAAGDCATIATHPALPKAGVYAVREAPILAHNLRAAVRGGALRTFEPQPRFLSLLNTADGRAILSYGAFAWHSRWAWCSLISA